MDGRALIQPGIVRARRRVGLPRLGATPPSSPRRPSPAAAGPTAGSQPV